MPITGRSTIPVEPAQRKTGAKVERLPEASSQTYPAGCILVKSAGLVQMHTTSNISVSLFGVALRSGRNGTADGAKSQAYYRFEPNEKYKVAVSGSINSSQMGNTIALSQNTAGQVFAITAAAASDSSVARAVAFVDPFVSGDSNPVIYFTPLAAKIQEG